MSEVMLTRAAFQALKAEAMDVVGNAITERHRFRDEEEGERQLRILLACADVLGELHCKELCFRDFDHTTPEEEKHAVGVEFTDEAMEWLRETRNGTRGHLEFCEASGEGDLTHCQSESFLLRVLDRIVGSADREAVTV